MSKLPNWEVYVKEMPVNSGELPDAETASHHN